MPTAPEAAPPLLVVEGLRVLLPDGTPLLEELSLTLRPGEVAVLLGGSGAGKSTFARVLFEREALERDGFRVEAKQLVCDAGELGLVPQRGALFDHLDVRGNLDLAKRYGAKPTGDAPEVWVERVGLDPGVLDQPVATLSGGEAQRVAVARALAGGRRLLFLDEPSVGLDPHRVRLLAQLVRAECATGAAAVVVTHDVALAAGVGDKLYVLDPTTRKMELLFPGEWRGPATPAAGDGERGAWLARLEDELATRIAKGERRSRLGRAGRTILAALGAAAATILRPFGVATTALVHVPGQALLHPGDFLTIAWRVCTQALLRPLPFYAVVSSLVGYTVLYVISKVGGAGFANDAGIRLVGGSYVIALAPVLSAMLFVAASGNAVNAWLGSMGLTRQIAALEALGVRSRRYLWAPAWAALAFSYLACAALFAGGMLLGGLALCRQLHVHNAWELLSADLLDPRPERQKWLVRAGFLVWCYAWGLASDVVAKGGAEKRVSDDVTAGMTRSVVASTLWVVLWELATAVAVFAS